MLSLPETCYTYTLQGPIHYCQNVHHTQPQQEMDFIVLFLLALYLLWYNFLISEMTSIQVNTTKKTPCQPQSVHSVGMLIAENVTLPQLHDFRL